MVRISLAQRIGNHFGSRSGSSTPSGDEQQPRTPPALYPPGTAGTNGKPMMPLILKANIIRGRNLAAKDRGGTSDPYLVVTLGDARESTPTISKTLNPDWNVTFQLPVLGVPLLECICWDKDRLGRDYLGEFDIALEDIFADGQVVQPPKWYKLDSKMKTRRKKQSGVSGKIQLQFSLYDSSNPSATPDEIYQKFRTVVGSGDDDDDTIIQPMPSPDLVASDSTDDDDDDGTDEQNQPDVREKRRRRLRLARLKRRSLAARAYEFSGAKDGVSGIVFMEVSKVLDLPPEKNMTRTSFDMDPFVVTSLGRKTLRTRVIRHNLNPVFDEKMVFQIMKHEQMYSFNFSVVDRDKLSGNDFVASANFPLQSLIHSAPVANPETGLYHLPGQSEFTTQPTAPPLSATSKSRFRLPISRSHSSSSISKLSRPPLASRGSAASLSSQSQLSPRTSQPQNRSTTSLSPDHGSLLNVSGPNNNNNHHHHPHPHKPGNESPPVCDTPPAATDLNDLKVYTIPLTLKNKERWESKHSPVLHARAKYMPYAALRQQFWRVMLKQYDVDESNRISKVELVAMLDTLGSTLKESTIDSFFHRFAHENQPSDTIDLTFDQAVISLEETLQSLQKKTVGAAQMKSPVPQPSSSPATESETQSSNDELAPDITLPLSAASSADPSGTARSRALSLTQSGGLTPSSGEETPMRPDDLADERGVEHVIELSECPLCHQPRLSKRSDADIITHIATCASQDWRKVDNLVMGGFVTSSQAQRKWYSKVITKISYGGYKLGANSANILVQDRITGHINEERMSVYVRLGIRLLYKGIKSRDMEKKRIRKMLKSMSLKQGRKYDDPASTGQIEDFITFHRLDMSEVLLPVEQFQTFNQFFYRALKPEARPCSAPNDPNIIVSPADCRSVVFDRIDDATRVWVKGREFSLERLLGNAYPEDVERYRGGAMGVFRLAPQDYHRFHVPVDGVMAEPKTIAGNYYTVNPMAVRSALDVFGENVRVLVPIDSVAHGRVMVICVGAMMVGSTIITREEGETVTRAEELGYFKFGGSTLLVLFEPGRMNYDGDLVDNSKGALETLIRVGMSIGHSPHVGQYTPDMRKSEDSVTLEEKREAKRKIGGSLTPVPTLEVTSSAE